MLKLTKKADYGLIALRHLATAPQACSSAKDISEAYRIPLPLLSKVLQKLVKAGLLPRLAEHVIAVYVEATAQETEARLLSGLRKRCPSLAQKLSESFCQPFDWRISAVFATSGASTGYFFRMSAHASAYGSRFGSNANGRTLAWPEPL